MSTPTPHEVLLAAIKTFMTAMPNDYVDKAWDGYTITFFARRTVDEVTEVRSAKMARSLMLVVDRKELPPDGS